jgi:hypothetical protein
MRFIAYINGIPSYIIKKFDRPKFTSAEVEINHININRWVKGKSKWESTTIELYDPIVPSGAQAVMEWIRLSHESVTGRDGYADFYQTDLTVCGLGPVGDICESIVYKNAWIKDADFHGWDWGDENTPQQITMTVRYNYPVLNF